MIFFKHVCGFYNKKYNFFSTRILGFWSQLSSVEAEFEFFFENMDMASFGLMRMTCLFLVLRSKTFFCDGISYQTGCLGVKFLTRQCSHPDDGLFSEGLASARQY